MDATALFNTKAIQSGLFVGNCVARTCMLPALGKHLHYDLLTDIVREPVATRLCTSPNPRVPSCFLSLAMTHFAW